MLETLERIDDATRVVEQIHQRYRDRLDWPPTKIPERYNRLQYSIGLKLVCQLGLVKFGMFPLISFYDGMQARREDSGTGVESHDEFSVLIDNVEVVDHKQGIVNRIGGIVRLEQFDLPENVLIRDRMYLSVIKLTGVTIQRPFLKDRELNFPAVVLWAVREHPHDVVEAGSEMVDNFTGQNAESW
ncbi:MAG TPA: hypothetical protein VJV22_07900, partial [Acidobacteriaceae bacterium]|nr:hypothetical protein [Acidobacteriaceae bacterium]